MKLFNSIKEIKVISASQARNNYSKLVKESSMEQKPIFVFNNNKAESVILSIDVYEKLVDNYYNNYLDFAYENELCEKVLSYAQQHNEFILNDIRTYLGISYDKASSIINILIGNGTIKQIRNVQAHQAYVFNNSIDILDDADDTISDMSFEDRLKKVKEIAFINGIDLYDE